LQFGSVDAALVASRGMKAIADLVGSSEGSPIQVEVLHSGDARPESLSLTPARWEGRGLLGCHLQPMPLA